MQTHIATFRRNENFSLALIIDVLLKPEWIQHQQDYHLQEEGQKVETIRVRCLCLVIPMALRQPPNVAGFEVEAGASGWAGDSNGGGYAKAV